MTKSNVRILCGICPNLRCQKKLYFPDYEASIECSGCSQRHAQSVLKNLERPTDDINGTVELIELLLTKTLEEKKKQQAEAQHEDFKVNGLSNYLCSIVSPFLTHYGMDKTSGKAKLLKDMGKADTFDCGQLCDRAFLIDIDHLNVSGYGRDRSGSEVYLQDTLNLIKFSNNKEESLVPVHADGDGHCLVHAVSRALIGWELFWHPLRVNLKQHLQNNIDKYKMQFGDFIDSNEWPLIISECDPSFIPTGMEPTGLRNIHIFGLANVLRRPIILLDTLEGIKSPGDYSGVFLPYFCPPSNCKNKDGLLNSPLCIAWSSSGRNHFIPLVGVRGKKCPVLPRHMIQRAWGVPDVVMDDYLQFDDHGNCQIGGEKVLQSGYIQKLVAAMGQVFFQNYQVSPSLVADFYHQIFRANGLVFGINIFEDTLSSVVNEKLFTCLACHLLTLGQDVEAQWCHPGGELYELAIKCHGTLKDGQKYRFPLHDVVATYRADLNQLVPDSKRLGTCHCGNSEFRLVRADYTIAYKNGDRTKTKSNISSSGYKHFWNGREYDTIPKRVFVQMEWGGKPVKESVLWFQNEQDPSLNSNVYKEAQDLVQRYFPGEFGSERLVQRIVDQILLQVNVPPSKEESGKAGNASGVSSQPEIEDDEAWSPTRASKAILTGMQSKSIHKEELDKSATERQVKQNIAENAWKQQRRSTDKSPRGRKSPVPGVGIRKTPERKELAQSQINVSQSSAMRPSVTAPQTLPVNKRIRLSTSDGKNVTLDLPADCKFLELQSLIASAVNVPPACQRIRYGFPPRELKPPESDVQDYKVPVQPGDKIMLDIISQPVCTGSQTHTDTPQLPRPVDKSSIHGLPQRPVEASKNAFAEGGVDEVSDQVLMRLMDPLLNNSGDRLDHCLSSLALTAALEHRDMWSYVQRLPHLFSVSGLFYKQVERDMGLEHGKHCTLPLLPGKVFVYNADDDRLELCLEPYGHFAVENRIESQAQNMLPSNKCGLKATNKPFSGPGHSLRSTTSPDDRMPSDLPMSPKRHEARRANTLCDPACPAFRQESIEEEEESVVETKEEEPSLSSSSHCLPPSELLRHLPIRGLAQSSDGQPPSHTSKLVRRGPGYSELSPILENSSNEKADILHQLVSHIEQAVESMGQEADAIYNTLSPKLTSPFSGVTQDSTNISGSSIYTTNDTLMQPSSSSVARYSYSPERSFQRQHTNLIPNSSVGNSVHGVLSTASSDPSIEPVTNLCQSGNNVNASATTSLSDDTSDSVVPKPTDLYDSAKADPIAMLAGEVASGIAAMDEDFNNQMPPITSIRENTILPLSSDMLVEASREVSQPQIIERIDFCEHSRDAVDMMDTAPHKELNEQINCCAGSEKETDSDMNVDIKHEDDPHIKTTKEFELDDLIVKEDFSDIEGDKQTDTVTMDST